ncbi:MAG: TlpA disulfide reductase family protein [Bacteroidetes bacterium]|nr:TlpA disulfide reductase family protein [Bacteroidota bacterium]
MKFPFSIFILILFISGIQPQILNAQPKIVKFSTIDSLLHHRSDSLLVINFWATWCKPCVSELPYFEELKKNYSSEKVKLILVSLDFKREFESRVKPFIEKNNIASEVLLLDEPDYNSWIDKVDATWSGAIPATVVIAGSKKMFFEKEFISYAELENIIKPLIQK